MKSKKFILTLAAVILSFCAGLTACDIFILPSIGSSNENSSSFDNGGNDEISAEPPIETSKAEFTVMYDYGLHVDGKATMLLSGSVLFFDPMTYNLSPLFGGDVLTVYYTGEMYIQETYPSKVVISDGEIVSVQKDTADVIRLVKGENGLEINGTKMRGEIPQYVIFDDGSFAEISSLPQGTPLWATYYIAHNDGVDVDYSLEDVDLSAVYAYDPHYPIVAESLYPWLDVSSFSVQSVIKESGYIGVRPGNLVDVKVSNDVSEVLSYFSALRFKEVAAEIAEIDGGSFETLTVKTSDGAYTMTENNGYFKVDGKYYEANIDMPYLPNGDTMYRFTDGLEKEVLCKNGETVREYDSFASGILFKATDDVITYPQTKFVLRTDLYLLYIADERHFWFEEGGMSNVLYEVVGERDFSEIFEEFGE